MTAQLYYNDKKIYSKLLKGLESIRDDIYSTNNDKLKLFYHKFLLKTLTNVRDILDQGNIEKYSSKQVQKDSFEQVHKVVPKRSIVDKINEQLDIFNDNINSLVTGA